jgi:hypothetical protein
MNETYAFFLVLGYLCPVNILTFSKDLHYLKKKNLIVNIVHLSYYSYSVYL